MLAVQVQLADKAVQLGYSHMGRATLTEAC